MDDDTARQMPAEVEFEGDAPSPEAPTKAIGAGVTPEEEEAFYAAETLLLLLAGALLEGSDVVQARLRRWRAETAAVAERERAVVPPQSSRPLRHGLMGLILHSPKVVRQQLALADRFAQTVFAVATLPMKPLMGSRLWRRAQGNFDGLVAEGESAIAAWVAAGHAAEPIARAMARRASNDVIDELIRHLSENPELSEMIQSQSASLAGEVTDSLRSRTVSADSAVERVARTLLRRQELPETSEAATVTKVEGSAGR
jgi:hypothetical protein